MIKERLGQPGQVRVLHTHAVGVHSASQGLQLASLTTLSRHFCGVPSISLRKCQSAKQFIPVVGYPRIELMQCTFYVYDFVSLISMHQLEAGKCDQTHPQPSLTIQIQNPFIVLVAGSDHQQ